MTWTKEYYEKNREAILEQQRERRKKVYECPCGSRVKLPHKAEHLQTMKHYRYIQENRPKKKYGG